MLCGPVRAESDGTTVVASPQASSSGSVTTTVQFKSIRDLIQPKDSVVAITAIVALLYLHRFISVVTFIQATTPEIRIRCSTFFSVPLDGSITELCKELPKEIQKTRV